MKIEKKDFEKKLELIQKTIQFNKIAEMLYIMFSALFGIVFFLLIVKTPPPSTGLMVAVGTLFLFSVVSFYDADSTIRDNKARKMLYEMHIKTFFDKNYKPEEYL